MRLKLQILLRYLKAQNKTLKMTVYLSSLGVILGVTCLVLTMSVVSGVQRLIQDSITDLTGHMLVVYRGDKFDPEELDQKLKNITPEYLKLTPFISPQGIIVNKGEILGIVIHGIQKETALGVIHPDKRVIDGKFQIGMRDDLYEAAVGKEIAKKLKLKIGDVFSVVVPKPSIERVQNFNPKVQKLYLTAILDFGKYDYNEKVILTSDKAVQNLLNVGDEYVGAYLKFKDVNDVPKLSKKISEELGMDYRARDWKELNYNFFSAVELEKVVIFIVVLFIVIVASFNVSSSVFVSVLRKFGDISILKTLGASPKFLVQLFVLQGLLMGVVSAFIGILLGIILSLVVRYTNLVDVPGDVYKFDHLPIDIRFGDIAAIFIVSVLICFVSSILPARRGSKLKPVEGLKYE
jgi:lipoprotein-releasing system permease protein